MKRTILVEGRVAALIGDERGDVEWIPIQDSLAIPEDELNLYVPLTTTTQFETGRLYSTLGDRSVTAFAWFDKTERLWYCKPNPYIDADGIIHLDR